ncbi:MAG: thioredoxin family protein [Polyangiaceae bacterium]
MAHHDTAVALLVAATSALALAGCAPLPPNDPTVTLRDTTAEDAEAEADAPDPAPTAAPKPIGPLTWVSSDAAAVAQSKAERRPMIVHVAAEWCAACKRMATETFRDPQVQAQAGRFVALRIDATNEDDPQLDAVLAKYEVIGVPTLILFDSKGHEQRRFTDFIPPEKLLGEIAGVR